jgi:hypothetical protein
MLKIGESSTYLPSHDSITTKRKERPGKKSDSQRADGATNVIWYRKET